MSKNYFKINFQINTETLHIIDQNMTISIVSFIFPQAKVIIGVSTASDENQGTQGKKS